MSRLQQEQDLDSTTVVVRRRLLSGTNFGEKEQAFASFPSNYLFPVVQAVVRERRSHLLSFACIRLREKMGKAFPIPNHEFGAGTRLKIEQNLTISDVMHSLWS